MRTSILVAAAVVFGGLMYAGASSHLDEQGPDLKVVEEALQLLSKGERAGFDVLAKRFPPKNADPKGLDSQARLIRIQVESLGEPCGFELVGAEGVGGSIRGYTYLCKYEDGCMRWRFNFYRPKGEWKLNGYWFDTNNDNALFLTAGYKLPVSGASESVAERPRGHQN
jgi:hypothetical protein